MRKGLFDLYLVFGAVLFLAASCPSRSQPQPSSAKEDSLKSFLRHYLGDNVGNDKTTRYSFAFVSLRDDVTQQVIVYVTGHAWCGSGGCTTLILTAKDSSYQVVTKLTVTRPPIRVLTSKSNGWHDIGVWVQGGGIQPGYEAEVRFDGKTYPSNASTSQRTIDNVAGEVVIPVSGEGTPLF
jgi:hypothetical protein